MVDKILYVVTVPMVYLALAWLVLGVIARIVMVLRAPAHPHTLKIFPERKAAPLVALWESFTMPTVRKNKPLFWVFLMLFHLGFGALILSHLDLLPQISLGGGGRDHLRHLFSAAAFREPGPRGLRAGGLPAAVPAAPDGIDR